MTLTKNLEEINRELVELEEDREICNHSVSKSYILKGIEELKKEKVMTENMIKKFQN